MTQKELLNTLKNDSTVQIELCSASEFKAINDQRTNCYVLILGMKGFCEIQIDHHTFRITKSSITIIPPLSTYSLQRPSSDYAAQIINFESTLLCTGIFETKILQDLLFINPEYAPTFPLKRIEFHDFCYKFKKIKLELDHDKPFGIDMIRLYLIQLLYEYNRICEVCLINSDTSINRKYQITQRFRNLVKEHIKIAKDVAFYADKLHISPKYLSECVHDQLGYSALRLIQNQLMVEAELLLKYGDMNIKQIALMFNFDTANHFSRLFYKLRGMTPTDYRSKP